jgi:hypothetical protein
MYLNYHFMYNFYLHQIFLEYPPNLLYFMIFLIEDNLNLSHLLDLVQNLILLISFNSQLPFKNNKFSENTFFFF